MISMRRQDVWHKYLTHLTGHSGYAYNFLDAFLLELRENIAVLLLLENKTDSKWKNASLKKTFNLFGKNNFLWLQLEWKSSNMLNIMVLVLISHYERKRKRVMNCLEAVWPGEYSRKQKATQAAEITSEAGRQRERESMFLWLIAVACVCVYVRARARACMLHMCVFVGGPEVWVGR